MGQNGGGGGTITGDIIGFGGGFLEKLRAPYWQRDLPVRFPWQPSRHHE